MLAVGHSQIHSCVQASGIFRDLWILIHIHKNSGMFAFMVTHSAVLPCGYTGTIILLSTIFVWFTTYFGWVDGTFRMLDESEIDSSILAAIGGAICWIFKPLGWGNWQATVASITGLVAKENIVGTLGILYGGGDGTVYQNIAQAFTGITGYSFLVFNLLCAPCFAAIGAIKREMNNHKWTWFAIGYQCGFAYLVGLMINQFGNAFTGSLNIIGLIAALAALALIVYMLVRPYKEATKLSAKV